MPEHSCDIYVALTGAALWIVTNLALRATGHAPFDGYPFVALQGVVAISIVTTETRLVHLRDRLARLGLHMDVITEQKIAKVIELWSNTHRRSGPA